LSEKKACIPAHSLKYGRKGKTRKGEGREQEKRRENKKEEKKKRMNGEKARMKVVGEVRGRQEGGTG